MSRTTAAAALLCFVVAGCKPLRLNDELRSCQSAADCAAGELCSSDFTCWKPPAVPPPRVQGLQATWDDKGVHLSWAPAERATSYSIARIRTSADVVPLGKQTGVTLFDGDVVRPGYLTYSVTANNDPGAGQAATVPVYFKLPKPTAVVGTHGWNRIGVSWDAPVGTFKSYTVASRPPVAMTYQGGNSMEAEVDASLEVSYSLELTAYTMAGDPTEPITVYAMADKDLPPPTNLTAQWGQSNGSVVLIFSFVGSRGATSYELSRDGAKLPIGCSTYSCWDTTAVNDGVEHLYEIRARNGTTVSAPAQLRVSRPPPPPVATFSPYVGGVEVTWSAVVGATGYDVADDLWVVHATTAGTSLIVPTDLYPSRWYIRSRSAVGPGDWSAISPAVAGLPAVTQSNPSVAGAAPVQLKLRQAAVQTFTVAKGGFLRSIEVSAAAPTSTLPTNYTWELYSGGALLRQGYGSWTLPASPPALDPNRLRGSVLSGAQLDVSAGAVLELRLYAAVSLGLGADAPGATLTVDGVQRDRDLAFQVAITGPVQTRGRQAQAGVNEIELNWDAEATATRYRLRDIQPTPAVDLGETANLGFVDRRPIPAQALYEITPFDAAGNALSVQLVAGASLGWTTAAANLAGTEAIAAERRPTHFVTLPGAGLLYGLDLSLVALQDSDAPQPIQVTVRNAAGGTVGTQYVYAGRGSCCALPGPLAPGSRARFGFVPLSPLGVQAGQRLSVEVYAPAGTQALVGASATDDPNSRLLVDGAEVPGKALTYQVYVKP